MPFEFETNLPDDIPLLLLRAGDGRVSLLLLLLCCWGTIDSSASAMASGAGTLSLTAEAVADAPAAAPEAPRLPRDPLGEWLGVGWVTRMLMAAVAAASAARVASTPPEGQGPLTKSFLLPFPQLTSDQKAPFKESIVMSIFRF